MLATLKLRLTLNAPNLKGRLCVEISSKSSKGLKRNFVLVQGLISPKYDDASWDGVKFLGSHSIPNNACISEIMEQLQSIIDCNPNADASKIKAIYEGKDDIVEDDRVTLGDFLTGYIAEIKSSKVSTNYECYNTLLHKLQGINLKGVCLGGNKSSFNPPMFEGIKLLNIPVESIENKHFVSFCKWVLRELNGKGYRNLCTTFKAAINAANDKLGYNIVLNYSWRKYQPKPINNNLTAKEIKSSVITGIAALSVEQIKMIEGLDVSELLGNNNQSHKLLYQLYKDTALLMYYTLSRPIDVIQFKEDNILWDDMELCYNVYKLRNRPNSMGQYKSVVEGLNDKAIEIIERYKGVNKLGYLLPLPINNKCWSSVNYDVWVSKIKRTEQKINYFLKLVANKIGYEGNLTLYTFRHSAITHAVNEGKLTPFQIAAIAGTSIQMISTHYYNPVTK